MESRSAQAVRQRLLDKGLGSRFCLVPFTTLTIEPDGQVGCCRQKGSDFPVGNLHEQSLEEIWNGAFLRKWRREFIEGFPQICKKELRHSSCNLCPEYNTLLEQIDPAEIQNDFPLRLGLNLNGKCNLRCQMCVVWRKPNGVLPQLDLLNEIEPHVKRIREVELHSGEPFVQKDTFLLMDWLGSRSPDCLWTITTNGHWKLTETLKRSLDKIRFKNLIVSLDSVVPATYARIRRGGKLERVLSNIERLTRYDCERKQRGLGSMNIRINFLIQRDNWMELPRIAKFERDTGLACFRTLLVEPFDFSLLTMSQREREDVLNSLQTSLSNMELRSAMRVLLPLVDSLPRLDQAYYWQRLHAALFAADNAFRAHSEVRKP